MSRRNERLGLWLAELQPGAPMVGDEQLPVHRAPHPGDRWPRFPSTARPPSQASAGLWYHCRMASPRDWVAGSPLRIGFLTGSLFVTAQVVRSLVAGDGSVGVALGVLGGVLFGGIVGRGAAKQTESFTGLTREQRAEIAHAIRNGDAPRDPALAQPTIEWARRLQQHDLRWLYLMFGAVAVLSLGLAASDALEGSLTIGAVLLAVFWLLLPPFVWWQDRCWTDRGRRAEAAAYRMAGRGPPAS